MRTEDLIETLAAGARPVRGQADRRWLGTAAALGAAASAVVLASWLGLPPLGETLPTAAFWMKAAYAAALAACGWTLARRLSCPAGQAGGAGGMALAVVGVLALVGTAQLAMAPPALARVLLFGSSWTACPFRILGLATPILLALMLAARRLAPTRPRAAGAAMGLLAGAVAMAVYGLTCRETSAAFVAVWYSLGVAMTVLLGAAAAGRVLRW
jgi:hypothetical protein